MSPRNIFHFLCSILLVTTSAFAQSRYSTAMQDAHAIPQEVQDFIDSNPQWKAFIELKDTSIAALQSRVDFLQAELEKISRLFAAHLRGPRKETHISGSEQTWLPFDSQEELDQARAQAEADAQKVIDDNKAKQTAPPKKPKTQALPSHLPTISRVYDVSESQRICTTHLHNAWPNDMHRVRHNRNARHGTGQTVSVPQPVHEVCLPLLFRTWSRFARTSDGYRRR